MAEPARPAPAVALWPYVIVYRITPEGVQILRIWHGAQDRFGE